MTTLGALLDDGLALFIYCNKCGHQVKRDALTLCLLLSRDRPIAGLWRIFRCTECGAAGRNKGDVYSMPEQPPYRPGGYGACREPETQNGPPPG